MKIAILEPNASGHRFSLYVRLAIEALLDQGWEPILVTSEHASHHAAYSQLLKRFGDSLKVDFIDWEPWRGDLNTMAKLKVKALWYWQVKSAIRKIEKKHGLDLVYIPYLDYFDKIMAVLGSPFRKLPFLGVLLTPKHHQKSGGLGPGSKLDLVYRLLFLRLLSIRRTCAFAVIDEMLYKSTIQSDQKYLEKLKFLPDVGEIKFPIEKSAAREAIGIDRDCFAVLVYGSIDQRKGLLELLASLSDQSVDDRVVVIVAGAQSNSICHSLREAKYSNLIRSSRVIIRSFFHSELQESQVFSASDVVWLGYNGFYGSSGVLYQACSLGIPTIACYEGLIGRITHENGLGIVVNPAESEKVADALRELQYAAVKNCSQPESYTTFAQRHSSISHKAALVEMMYPLLPGNDGAM